MSAMLSDSMSNTRRRNSVIHNKCDRYLRALLAHAFLSVSAVVLATPRYFGFAFWSHTCCNLVTWLMSRTFSHQRRPPSGTNVSGNSRGGPTGSVVPNKDRTPPATGMCGSTPGRNFPPETHGLEMLEDADSVLRLDAWPHIERQPADLVLRAEVHSLIETVFQQGNMKAEHLVLFTLNTER